MRISTRLKIISTVTLAALVVLAPVLIWSFIEFKSAKNDYVLADLIKVNSFEHAAFRDQYFLYREDRAHKQWDSSNETADRLLRQAKIQFHGEEDRQALERLRNNIADSTAIFHRIVDNTEVLKKAADNRHVYEELDKSLFSQLLLKAAATRDTATALQDASARRVELAYRHLTVIIGLFAATLALVTILTSIHLGRLIRKRLAPLHDGAKIVADGDLGYRIKCGGSDEFAELALSINAMTDKLQAFTRQLEAEIGAHKQSEETLEEALDRLQKIASRVPGVVYQYRLHPDGSSCFPFASEAIREIYRVSPEEVREDASKVFTILHPDDYDGIVASIQKSARDLTPWHHEYRVKFDDGTVRWLYGNALPQTEAGGSVLWHGFITDITERKQAEEELHASEQKFMRLFMLVPIPLGVVNKDGVIAYFNDPFTRVFGYTTDDVPTMKEWWQLAYPDASYRQWVMDSWGAAVVKAAKEGTDIEPAEYRVTCKNGAERIVLIGGAALEDNVLATFIDITERKQAEEMLRKLSIAVEQSPASVVITDLEACIQYVNPRFTEVTGYSAAEVIGQNPRILQSGQTAKETYLELWGKLSSGLAWHGELINKRKNGELYWEETHIAPVKNPAGAVTHYVAMKADISERKRAEKMLLQSEASLRAILDNSPYLIWLKDMGGRFIAVNKAFFNTTGRAQMQDVLGKTDFDLWPKELARKYRADDAEVMSTRRQKLTEEMLMDNGKICWVETFKAPIMDVNGHLLGTTGFAQDITGRKNAESQIRHLAHYDPLTDLPNRTLLSDRLQQALATAKRDKAHMSILFIDLDKFKPINDALGHHVGDLLLKEAAKRMQDCVRESDTVARIGGDEFVVLLPVIEAEQDAMLVAEKIRHALNRPFVLVGQSLKISSSTGVAVYPEHGSSETQLVKNADIAMYHAKESGRNNVKLYQADMQDGKQ